MKIKIQHTTPYIFHFASIKSMVLRNLSINLLVQNNAKAKHIPDRCALLAIT